jgi:hypothetical protein
MRTIATTLGNVTRANARKRFRALKNTALQIKLAIARSRARVAEKISPTPRGPTAPPATTTGGKREPEHLRALEAGLKAI